MAGWPAAAQAALSSSMQPLGVPRVARSRGRSSTGSPASTRGQSSSPMRSRAAASSSPHSDSSLASQVAGESPSARASALNVATLLRGPSGGSSALRPYCSSVEESTG